MSTCPRCSSYDSVQSLTAINRAGRTSFAYDSSAPLRIGETTAYIPVSMQATIQTSLSVHLSPPTNTVDDNFSYMSFKYPNWVRKMPNWEDELKKFFWRALGLIIISSGLMVVLVIATEGNVVTGFVLGLLPVVAFYIMRSSWLSARNEYRIQALQELEKAKKRWSHSYYCSRCDVVFEEGTKNYAPVDNYYSYLWR